ncbi:unnamed protein product [Tilletia controversa]|nr:unnamed protein product [Tilletia controversa]
MTMPKNIERIVKRGGPNTGEEKERNVLTIAQDNHRARIIPRHLQLAIGGDEELKELIGNATLSQGGVLPFIHRKLLPAQSGKNKKNPSKEL